MSTSPDLSPEGIAARKDARQTRVTKARMVWAVIALAAVAGVVSVVLTHHSSKRTPEQVFIDSFNDSTGSSVTKASSKDFLIRAGRGFCTAAKSVTDVQATNDISIFGVSDRRMAEGIAVAAREPGSLCPKQ